MMSKMENVPVTLQSLFPNLSEAELMDVQEALDGYCETMSSIYERLEREQPGLVDELAKSLTIKSKVDSSEHT